ncbi:MAG TPA: hypothetical protein VFR81_13600 [Longimicrobium sp.]|nr:hypothetical protein [Longimicrobium sp.]
MQAIGIARRCAVLAALVSAAGCVERDPVPRPPVDAGPYAGTPEVVEDSVLRFASGTVYAPRVYGLGYVGTMRDGGGALLLVLSGAECHACDAPRAVYFRAPGRPLPPQESDTLAVFGYPGRVTDGESGTLLSVSTLFYGECLEGRGPVAVQYATNHEESPPGMLVNLTDFAAGGYRDHDQVPRPDSAGVLARVAAGRCREVPPAEQIAMP